MKTQAGQFRAGSGEMVKKWSKQYGPVAKRLFHEAKYRSSQYRLFSDAMKKVESQKPLVLKGGRKAAITAIPVRAQDTHTMFFRIDPPPKSKVGDAWEFDVSVVDSATGKTIGGSRYKVVINKKV